MSKRVYLFHEGNADMRNLLGGKGANLAEMTNIGPMPSHYAHYYHGKEVTRILPDDIKDIINTGQNSIDSYIIGLQGPDILAFYMPYSNNRLNRLGRSIHQASAKDFFSRSIRTLEDHRTPESFSYLYGCLCHYMLDSACHPIVLSAMEETGLTHAAIEREFDNYILRISGKRPIGLDTSIIIPLNPALGEIISPFYPGISANRINSGIESMSKILGMMCSRSKRTRNALYTTLSHIPIDGVRDKRDMVVKTKPQQLAEKSSYKLWDELNRSVSDTAAELDLLMDSILLGKPLSDRLSGNFLGVLPE